MKKIVFLLTLISLLGNLVVPGIALSSTSNTDNMMSNSSQSQSPVITPFYIYTDSIYAYLSFSGNEAICSGTVDPTGTYNASITVTLYKMNGSNWDPLTSWSGSSTGGIAASAGGSYTVGSGTYKVTASANVGNGKEYPSKSVTKTK